MKFKNIFTYGLFATGIFFSSCDDYKFEAELPGEEVQTSMNFVTLEATDGSAGISQKYIGEPLKYEVKILSDNHTGSYDLAFDTSEKTMLSLKTQFAKYKGADLYQLLPSECYELPQDISIKTGNSKSEFTINLKDVPVGAYVLPLCIKHNEKEVGVQFIEVANYPKDEAADMSYMERIPTVAEPRTTAIIEASENDLRNVGNYMLEINGKKRPYFDMTVIFSANMNWDEALGKPTLFFNNDIETILSNRDVFITPLQNKGIKVLLSVMPNRQGIGFSNMSLENNHKMISDFAEEIAKAIKKYGLDGVMFDDEYADYPSSAESVMPGRKMVQMGSFHYLIKELRDRMPFIEGQKWADRHNLITFYNLGINSSAMTGERGWGLFANDFENIKAWKDEIYDRKIAEDKKALREWVKNPDNAEELDAISKIKVGELLDFIWNGNYLRGDDYYNSNEGRKPVTESWFAGMNQEDAQKKFGMASFEMSLIAYEWGIYHNPMFWQKANWPEPGRSEDRTVTFMKQVRSKETNLMFFNLSYIPNEFNGKKQKNLYLRDLEEALMYLGSRDVKVTFEGNNYATKTPSYLK